MSETTPGGVLDFRMVTHDETGQFSHPHTFGERKSKFQPIFFERRHLPTHFKRNIPFFRNYYLIFREIPLFFGNTPTHL